LFRIGQEGEHGGGRGCDLGLAPDHERFSHRSLLVAAARKAAPGPLLAGIIRDKATVSTHVRSMQLSSTLSWLVDTAGETPGAERVLAGGRGRVGAGRPALP